MQHYICSCSKGYEDDGHLGPCALITNDGCEEYYINGCAKAVNGENKCFGGCPPLYSAISSGGDFHECNGEGRRSDSKEKGRGSAIIRLI